jgi:predicted amidohydrolase YtcJ
MLDSGIMKFPRLFLQFIDIVGTLEPGKYADFVVLSENPLEADPMKINDIKLETTVMVGRITYLVSTGGLYHH